MPGKDRKLYIVESENGELYASEDRDDAIDRCEEQNGELVAVIIEVTIPATIRPLPPKKIYPTISVKA